MEHKDEELPVAGVLLGRKISWRTVASTLAAVGVLGILASAIWLTTLP